MGQLGKLAIFCLVLKFNFFQFISDFEHIKRILSANMGKTKFSLGNDNLFDRELIDPTTENKEAFTAM